MLTGNEAKEKECPFRLAKNKLVTVGYTKYEYAKCLGNGCGKWRLNMDFPGEFSDKCGQDYYRHSRRVSGDRQVLDGIKECQESHQAKSCNSCMQRFNYRCDNPVYARIVEPYGEPSLDNKVTLNACQRQHNVTDCTDCGDAYGYCGG